jgi:poly(A) polymerase
MHRAFSDWQTAKLERFALPPFAKLAHVKAVFEALDGAALVVGGAVRDWQHGAAIGDVDVATPLTPEQVMALAKAAGLGVHPTGLEHGTVTLVHNKQIVEVTSLRSDVSTDGRRATVAFTTSLKADAARRDFTINALYADLDGNVFDFFGGLEDLQAGRVRFIGEAKARIAEDYLRILRFFRFKARFAYLPHDKDAVQAICAARQGLKSLSKQRVRQEMLKLFDAEHAGQVLRQMHGLGVLAMLCPLPPCMSRFEQARARCKSAAIGFDSATALGALYLQHQGNIAQLDDCFVLTRHEKTQLEQAFTAARYADMPLEKRMYGFGKQAVLHALVIWASEAQFMDEINAAIRFEPPVFPVTGKDLLALGLPAGREIGAILKSLESHWLDNDFAPSKAHLLARLQNLA